MKHSNPHYYIPPSPKNQAYVALLFQFILQCSSGPHSQHSKPGTGPTATPGNPCVPCPNPFCPQLPTLGTFQPCWCPDHMFLAPLRKNRFKHDPHYACEQNSSSMRLLTQVLAYLKVQHFAESQLTVHKDLNMTHGLRAGHDLSACIANNAKPSAGTQTHSNSVAHKHATQTFYRHGRNRMGFGARHAQDHRKCSHCGDCHIFATSRVGAQQAHSLNEREKEFPWTNFMNRMMCMHAHVPFCAEMEQVHIFINQSF